MSLKPNGSDEWPEHLIVDYINYKDVFRLIWYYSDLQLDGFHNIPTAPHCETRNSNYVQPAYSCPGCNKVVLVPFPEVENLKELSHFFENHVKRHTRAPIVAEDVALTDETIQLIHAGLLIPNTKTIQKMAREIRVSRGVPNPDLI